MLLPQREERRDAEILRCLLLELKDRAMVVVGVGLGEWHTFMGEFFAWGLLSFTKFFFNTFRT